ncbi:MAG TPA: hypothetical protein VFH94_18820 [Streptomyces sp.]|nr:hypothetical protein [Streptomyces sp.]
MSHAAPGDTPRTAPTDTASSTDGGWASGSYLFAGVLLLVSGVMAVLQGIAAIVQDGMWHEIGDYVYRFNLSTWGWIHLVLGLVVAATGYGVLKGASWARATGVLLASLSLITQFLFLPYEPFWALVMIATDAVVIWALCTYQPAVAPRQK